MKYILLDQLAKGRDLREVYGDDWEEAVTAHQAEGAGDPSALSNELQEEEVDLGVSVLVEEGGDDTQVVKDEDNFGVGGGGGDDRRPR